jgi:hypothetical protein
MAMKVPKGIVSPQQIDWIGTAIVFEQRGKPKCGRAYCTSCPVKNQHRADLVWMNEDGRDIQVCAYGFTYFMEKECRRLKS